MKTTFPGNEGNIRIIGGRWRNTRLPVPDVEGLRPSSDRVRETLFNWLMPKLPRSRVLDLFAGTGALGLEAVSRGAAHATLVERNPGLVARLHATVGRLAAHNQVAIVEGDALNWLWTQPPGLADIAFVDPPFSEDLWTQTLNALLHKLSRGAWLYLEAPSDHPLSLPAEWTLHREGHTQDVHFMLYRGL